MPTYYPKLNTRSATCALIAAAENGVISWESIARTALDYMGEDDVADLAHSEFGMDPEEEEDVG